MPTGLVLQLTGSLAKIWLTSVRRTVTYNVDDLPRGAREGDWIDIEFDGNGALKGIHSSDVRMSSKFNVEERTLQVYDYFLLDESYGAGFSRRFAFVDAAEDFRFPPLNESSTHCYQLWVNIDPTGRLTIPNQSTKTKIDADDEKGHIYADLKNEAMAADLPSGKSSNHSKRREMKPVEVTRAGNDLRKEKVVVVGYGRTGNVYFVASRLGEAVIYENVHLNRDDLRKGSIFTVSMELFRDVRDRDIKYIVKEIIDRSYWDGVHVDTSSDLALEVDGVVHDRRETCFTLSTVPLGLVVYSFDKPFLPQDIVVNELLRVRIHRFKNEQKEDHPSKWQVTKVVERKGMSEEEPDVDSRRPCQSKDSGEWHEAIVSGRRAGTLFASFGNTHACLKYEVHRDNPSITLGTILDVRVSDEGENGLCKVEEIGDRFRRREDMIVKEEDGKSCLQCFADVVGREDKVFVLQTPIIGTAIYFVEDAPDWMRIGGRYRMEMHRRKERRGFPSHWVAKRVLEDCTESEASSARSSQSIDCGLSEDGWETAILVGKHGGNRFVTSPRSENMYVPSRVYERLNVDYPMGTFLRVKVKPNHSDRFDVYDIHPDPVYPPDVEIHDNGPASSLMLWCDVTVEAQLRTSFTVRHYILGLATLITARAPKGLQVGDRLRALVYRVKDRKSNPSHWMVFSADFHAREESTNRVRYDTAYNKEEPIMSDSCRDRMDGRYSDCGESSVPPSELRYRVDKEIDNDAESDFSSSSSYKRHPSPGVLTATMHSLLKHSSIRDAIELTDPTALARLESIFARLNLI